MKTDLRLRGSRDTTTMPGGQYFLTEKFIGRLIAWFPDDLLAINLQVTADPQTSKRKKKKK